MFRRKNCIKKSIGLQFQKYKKITEYDKEEIKASCHRFPLFIFFALGDYETYYLASLIVQIAYSNADTLSQSQ